MSQRVVYRDGLWNGRPLEDWVPEVVADLAEVADPLKIILFGSVARGEAGPHSDIDLLVVLPEAPEQRWKAAGRLHAAVTTPVPVDILVTDPDEIARRGHLQGSALRPALTEGVVVYERGT